MGFKDILSKVGLASAVAAASEYARHHTKQYLDRQAAKQSTIVSNDDGLDEGGEPSTTVRHPAPDPLAYAKRKLSGALSGLRGNGSKRGDSTIDAFKRAHKTEKTSDEQLDTDEETVEETS